MKTRAHGRTRVYENARVSHARINMIRQRERGFLIADNTGMPISAVLTYRWLIRSRSNELGQASSSVSLANKPLKTSQLPVPVFSSLSVFPLPIICTCSWGNLATLLRTI